MYKEQATFQLKHADINSDSLLTEAASENGYWSNSKITTSWYIDLEKIVSPDVFNNYELFGLRLNQTSFTGENYGVANDDFQLVANIEGLVWNNCSYDVKTGNNTNKATLGVFKFASTGITTSYSPNVCVLNFRKSTPRVKITIDYVRLRDLEPPDINLNMTIPNGIFSFTIFPIR